MNFMAFWNLFSRLSLGDKLVSEALCVCGLLSSHGPSITPGTHSRDSINQVCVCVLGRFSCV